MRFHRDRPYQPTTDTEPERPYECTYVCAIHYLSDVEASDPCFCVVPNSGPYETLDEARVQLGDAYAEVPIRGPAGTLVLYDIAIFHTRLPGQRARARRTLHHYYSRAASQPLTNWVLLPKRLAEHSDPEQAPFTASGPRLPKPTPRPVFLLSTTRNTCWRNSPSYLINYNI